MNSYQHEIIGKIGDWTTHISSEESYKSAIKAFVSILEKHFGLFQADYFQIEREGKTLSFRRGSIRFPSASPVAERIVSTFYQTVPVILDNCELGPVCSSFQTIEIESQQILFVLPVTDPSGQTAILVWRQPNINEPSPAYRALNLDNVTIHLVIELLVKCLQTTVNWFSKLETTQSLVFQDDLTGLFNHRYLDRALESEFKRQSRFLTPFCILFIDLDGFKAINDVHGHLIGSKVLRDVGHLLKDAVRDVDIVIRYGGDEFIVLLIGANSNAGLLAAERIRQRIASARFHVNSTQTVSITASIGVACCPENGTNKSDILKGADKTMYESKRLGKNRVTLVDASPPVDEIIIKHESKEKLYE